MPMFTQAAQPRLTQRGSDSGRWIVPDAHIEEWDGAAWVDATEWFDTVGCTMSSSGGLVTFRFAAVRTGVGTVGNVYRLFFPEHEDTISTPQKIGELTIVSTVEGLVDEQDRIWASYPLVGLPAGALEVVAPFSKTWPTPMVGDVVQFNGTWFI